AAKGAPPPEVAALLGGKQTGKQGSQSGSPSTVVSPRRMAAAPAAPPPAPAAARPAPHLRAVPPEPAGATETFEIDSEAQPTQLAPIPHKAPPPPPVAKAQHRPSTPHPPPVSPVKPHAQPPSRAHVEAMEQPTSVQRPSKLPRKRSLPSLPARGEGRGAPKLFFELYWGETRRAAHSFGVIKPKKPVMGALDGLDEV